MNRTSIKSQFKPAWKGMAIAILISLALFLPASVVSGASQEEVRASTSTFKSLGADDGWILEAGENTNTGGIMLNNSTTLRLGDDALRKQYISILSFNTASLPDNAIVTKVTLKIQRQSVVGGINPVTDFQGFMVDVRKGTFGLRSLQLSDWKATANMTLGPFTIGTTGGWYVMILTNAQDFINKRTTGSGLTQIRLRFQVNDNNNSTANIFNFYSGNAAATKRPQLIVQYNVP